MADLKIYTDTVAGPSYTTGGISVNTGLSSISNFSLKVKVRDSLPDGHMEWTASGGTVTWKWIRHSHDKLTTIGDMSGLPAGVSAQSSSGGTYDADTTHTHSIDHDHAATTSAAPTASGVGVNTLVGSGNYSTHTHSFDVPGITATSGVGSSHTHTWDNIYQHQHSITNTATNPTQAELANGTDLSSATLIYHAVGT